MVPEDLDYDYLEWIDMVDIRMLRQELPTSALFINLTALSRVLEIATRPILPLFHSVPCDCARVTSYYCICHILQDVLRSEVFNTTFLVFSTTTINIPRLHSMHAKQAGYLFRYAVAPYAHLPTLRKDASSKEVEDLPLHHHILLLLMAITPHRETLKRNRVELLSLTHNLQSSIVQKLTPVPSRGDIWLMIIFTLDSRGTIILKYMQLSTMLLLASLSEKMRLV
ncbi:hypothetical protein WG66_001071 [Moniliophthora roreri]|nr:hypothetical protein WG66_001071 [Moniliophthora roreri]